MISTVTVSRGLVSDIDCGIWMLFGIRQDLVVGRMHEQVDDEDRQHVDHRDERRHAVEPAAVAGLCDGSLRRAGDHRAATTALIGASPTAICGTARRAYRLTVDRRVEGLHRIHGLHHGVVRDVGLEQHRRVLLFGEADLHARAGSSTALEVLALRGIRQPLEQPGIAVRDLDDRPGARSLPAPARPAAPAAGRRPSGRLSSRMFISREHAP